MLNLKTEHLSDIKFFTAISKKRGPSSVDRHNKYITVLENEGVKVIKGSFSKASGKEKLTDVNIAVSMMVDAFQDNYDKCFLMSGDNDFIPVLEAVNKICNKKAGIITPPYDNKNVKLGKVNGLKDKCYVDKKTNKRLIINLKFSQLKGMSFEKEIQLSRNDITIKMPGEYSTF